jgi:hypothetical protein
MTIKTVKAIYVIVDCGDGSSSNVYFKSHNAAQYWIDNTEHYGIIPEGVEVDTFLIMPDSVLKPRYGWGDEK